MFTTLNKIRYHNPCREGWETLLKSLGKTKADDEPLSLLQILDSNGLDDALWCLRAVGGFESEKRLLAVAYAREVQHLMDDPQSLKALDVAERHAKGMATDRELKEAQGAAYRSYIISAAANATWYATDIAAARSAARSATDLLVSLAVRDAAWFASSAARNSSGEKQEAILRSLLERQLSKE